MTFNEWTKKQGFSAAELAGPLYELEGCWNSASKAQIKELKQLFAVMVKPSARKRICASGLVWVKDGNHKFYVSKKDRGLWETKAEAESMITEDCEVIVEISKCQ